MADKPTSIKDATTSLAATLSSIDEHLDALEAIRERLIGAGPPPTAVMNPPINHPPSGSILDGIAALERMVSDRLNRLQRVLVDLDRGI